MGNGKKLKMALVWLLLAATLITQTLGSPLFNEPHLDNGVQSDELENFFLLEAVAEDEPLSALTNELEKGNELNADRVSHILVREYPQIVIYNETAPQETFNEHLAFSDFQLRLDPIIEIYNETAPDY